MLPWSTSAQHLEQLAHILEMQARGRLVQDVEGAAGGAAGELLGELDAPGLAALAPGVSIRSSADSVA